MIFEEYLSLFDEILNHTELHPQYQDPNYYEYAKMNASRTRRWLKKFVPTVELKNKIDGISEKQTWILITEPWCGDAAHSVPQIYELVKSNPNIALDIQLRDSEPYLIDKYLTNGGKSIPILVIRDAEGNDLGVWGPRPSKLQELFLEMKAEGLDMNEIKEFIQKWYNDDKGVELQNDLLKILA